MNTAQVAANLKLGLLLACAAALGLLAGMPARAELYIDPEPPMSYAEMQQCELVFVGHYEGHALNSLSLKVQEVLHGGVKADSVVVVKLEHNYCLETRPADGFRKHPEDGIPRLCYKQQLINPGDLEPVQVTPDAREPSLYFLPKASRPALVRRLQVQPVDLFWGWRDVLAGKPAPLGFRLMQSNDDLLAREALEELAVSRDADVLALVFERLCNAGSEERTPWACLWADSQHLLAVPQFGKAQLWDVKGGKLRGEFPRQAADHTLAQDTRATACFAPDGKRFAVANGRSIEIWSVEPLQRIAAWTPDAILSCDYLDWSRTGERLIVGQRRSAIVLDGDGKWLYSLGQLRAPHFSPDGQSIVADGGQIQLLDADTGKRRAIIEHPTNSPNFWDERAAVRLSPDGKSLVAVGAGEARVWKRD